MTLKNITIAIDGYAGTGKSSTAKSVAHALGYLYIDTGAMYRAVTMYLLDQKIPFDQESPALLEALDTLHLDFRRVEGKEDLEIYLNDYPGEPDIRQPRVSQAVSPVATLPSVREVLVAQQRRIGAQGAVVMDGRDIGTHVFPNADLKIFMTADINVRARRRQSEMAQKGIYQDLTTVTANLTERDRIDSTRAIAPLRQAADAVVIDTSLLSFEQQVEEVLEHARKILSKISTTP